MASDDPHTHRLLVCPDCDGWGCSYCEGRGYFEICSVCREPMGNKRRWWKRVGRPKDWVAAWYADPDRL